MKWLREIDEKTPFVLKLAGAFAIIIAVGVAVVYVLLQNTMVSTFEDYANQTSILHAQGMAPFFTYYYGQNGSWEGVEGLLVSMSGAHGPLGEHIVLADATGRVLGPTDSLFYDEILAPSLLNRGAPVMVEGQRRGTLLANLKSTTPPLLESRFLESIQRSILGAGSVAAGIALILGFLVTRRLTHPLRKLSLATHQIAEGKLNHRVEIHSKDIIGQLGSDFNTMAQKLSRSEELRRRLIADVAHELRTPLTVLQGNLQGLHERVFEPTPEILSSLYDESLLLSRLVNDLRDLSLAEAGELYLDKQPENIDIIIDRAITPMRSHVQDRHIELHVNRPAKLPTIQMDADRIVQVLGNLVSNALRYTPEGGTITVTVGRDEQMVRVDVMDTGPGIAPEELPHVFERFWRADRTRQRQSGGTGLGLAIAKNIVEAHGGEIGIESCLGRGTTLTFSLPLTK